MSAFHSTKSSEIFESGTNGSEMLLEKVPENLEIVKFPNSKLFERQYRKFKTENQIERKFSGNFFPKFGVALFFGNYVIQR